MPLPTPEHMQAVVAAYLRALHAGDLEAIVALYADDAVAEDPAGSPPRRGLADIRRFYAASLQRPLRVELEGVVRTAGHEAAFAFSVDCEYQGRHTRVWPINVLRFDADGRIAQKRAFFGPGTPAAPGPAAGQTLQPGAKKFRV